MYEDDDVQKRPNWQQLRRTPLPRTFVFPAGKSPPCLGKNSRCFGPILRSVKWSQLHRFRVLSSSFSLVFSPPESKLQVFWERLQVWKCGWNVEMWYPIGKETWIWKNQPLVDDRLIETGGFQVFHWLPDGTGWYRNKSSTKNFFFSFSNLPVRRIYTERAWMESLGWESNRFWWRFYGFLSWSSFSIFSRSKSKIDHFL